MSTLIFRLSAPMQAWGTEPRFDKYIRTGMEPSKSGVIGLIASALGLDRRDDQSLSYLAQNLHFGVRVDQEGTVLRDYQAFKNDFGPYAFDKYYLMDAKFTVGVESKNTELLKVIQNALRHPKRLLFLGRKNCPLTEYLDGDIVDLSLMSALTFGLENKAETKRKKYRILRDANANEPATLVNDYPVSFHDKKREYAPRGVVETVCEVLPVQEMHDPMAF